MHGCHALNRNDTLRVEIHTATHLILGAVPCTPQRLADLCDILARPRLPVLDANIQPLQRAGGERHRREERLLIDRAEIRLCIPYGCSVDREEEADGKHRPHAAAVSLHLSGIEVEGHVLAGLGQTADDVLQRDGNPFLVLVNARICYLDEALSLPFTAEAILVNKAHIRLVARQRSAARPMSRLAEMLRQSRGL